MKQKAVNLAVDRKFYEEMMKPILDDREIIYSKFMMAIFRKLKEQKRLSGYAIDSEIFPLEEYKIMNMYVNSETCKINEAIREIFAPNFKGKRQSAEFNKYLRDEVYGFFYNYDDKNMIELARKYGDISKDVVNNSKRHDNMFYSTSEDIEFLRMLKSEYDMNLIVEKFVGIMKSDSYDMYKEIKNVDGKFHTVFPVDIKVKKEHLNHCRFPLSLPTYGKLLNEANRYFLASSSLFSTILNYVKENIEDFEDCKVSKLHKRKHILMNMYSHIIDKYNIKESSDYRDIVKRIDINKLIEYVKHNKNEIVQVDKNDRVTISVGMENIDDNVYYTLRDIRKSYSIGWADIIRVALEKDLLKK